MEMCKESIDRFEIHHNIILKKFRVVDRYLKNVKRLQKDNTSLNTTENIVDNLKRARSLVFEIESNVTEQEQIFREQQLCVTELNDGVAKQLKVDTNRKLISEKNDSIGLLEKNLQYSSESLEDHNLMMVTNEIEEM